MDGLNCKSYVFKNTILPEYQGQGYGRKLTEYRLKRMKEQGYDYSIGHARDNSSIKQAKLFGAKVVGAINNWCGSGEEVFLCVLKLV